MQRPHGAFTIACTFGLALVSSGASAQVSPADEHPDVVVGGASSWPVRRSARADSPLGGTPGGISTTSGHQILVELAPAEIVAANLFDLNGRTLIFTPNGRGYSRSLQPVAWEDDTGRAVEDGDEIQLESFVFDFAGRRWSSFFVSRRGVLTFGGPFVDVDPWAETLPEIAARFVTMPTVSPLYKPFLGGRHNRGATQHVAHHPDRVVVTWKTSEFEYYDGVATFQAVLHADGSIRFSYLDVTLGDGIAGLFQNEPPTKVAPIARIPDAADDDLPGHLDIREAAIYESSASSIIVEFSTRGSMPEPDDGTWYSYRLHFDAEPPYFRGDSDLDMVWQVDVHSDGVRSNGQVLPTVAANRIAVDVGPVSEFSGMVTGGAAEFVANRNTRFDGLELTPIDLPTVMPSAVDLSRPAGVSNQHSEVFHWLSIPDIGAVACRVVEALGDEFDVFTFHSEFLVDTQWLGMDFRRYGRNVGVEGIGNLRQDAPPCGAARLKGSWSYPYPIDRLVLGSGVARWDTQLGLFAHEFTHAWGVSMSYIRPNGSRERLSDDSCGCHWRWELHVPVAFPWGEGRAATSLMGGTFWRDNGDGTWVPESGFRSGRGRSNAGHSWLDLYAIGLVDASEVPDMFVLRNAKPVRADDPSGPHTGEKEIVTIDQIVAAEGPRRPPRAQAQKDFNAGFVYLLEPGQTPDPSSLRLHRDYIAKVIEYWSHVTGGRSRITAEVATFDNGSPVAVGALPDLALHADGAAVVNVSRAFRDPDGDALTYMATSSVPGVAMVSMLGNVLTVTPVSAGTATVTVTATDTGGSNTNATQRFTACVPPNNLPVSWHERYLETWQAVGGSGGDSICGGTSAYTFTDHPIKPPTTRVKAVHFHELRQRIDAVREAAGQGRFPWTDSVLRAGVSPVKLVHLLELRSGLAAVYAAVGRLVPSWTDAVPVAGTTPLKAAHLMELRAAVVALE